MAYRPRTLVENESETRYRGLLEAAPDAMVVVNGAGEIVLLNVQAEKQFGYHRDELLGQPVTNIIPVGFAERLISDDLRSAADALAQQIGTGIELSGRRRDGSEFPIEIMLSPLKSADGILVTAAIRDISVRKNADEELRRTAELLGLIYDSVGDSIYLLAVEPDGVYRFESVNRAFLTATGLTRDQVVGRRVVEVLPATSHALVLRNYRRAIEEQHGVNWEEVAVYQSGTKVGEVSAVPLFDGQGRCTHLIGLVHDVTERVAAETRYRGLLEAAPDAMVVVNGAGEIVLLNVQAEKQFGYHRDELLGQPVTNIIPVGFAERLISDDLRSAADALAQQIGTGIELSGRRRDGSEFPIEIMLSPLESADGILVTAAIRDISVRKNADEELLQAQKLESIGRLAGGIAHDFNNMLFVINGHAEMLGQDLLPERRQALDLDETLRNIQAILEAGERAATLTSQLLAFSRQQPISPRVLDLNAAIDGLEPMVRKLIGENTRLVIRKGDPVGPVRADAGQLDQILMNLVVNARDAMPDGGTVTIETARRRG